MKNTLIRNRALRLGVALALSVLIYRYFSFTQGFWIPLTTAIVMQPTLSSTLRKGIQRFLGTICGILIGTVIVIWVQKPWLFDLLLVLTLFIAYYSKSFNLVSYGIFVIPLTVMVVMLVSALVPQEANNLILARFIDTGIGALVAIFVSYIFLPISHTKIISQGIHLTDKTTKGYYESLLSNKIKTYANRKEFEDCLTRNRESFHDSFYEFIFCPQKRAAYRRYTLHLEKFGQLLIGMDDFLSAKDPKPVDLRGIYLKNIDQQIKELELAKMALSEFAIG